MIYEVLYCIHPNFEYKKIAAIKPESWKWGPGELDTKVFKIIKIEIDDKTKLEIENENKYCIDATGKSLIVTADKDIWILPKIPGDKI